MKIKIKIGMVDRFADRFYMFFGGAKVYFNNQYLINVTPKNIILSYPQFEELPRCRLRFLKYWRL